MNDELTLIQKAERFLRAEVGTVQAVVVLGSGMSRVLAAEGVKIPYPSIPGFPVPTVEGHAGLLQVADIEGGRVAVLRGRAHLYEGYRPEEVVRPVRIFARLGARTFLATNAAGVVDPKFRPGQLMFLRDHLNFLWANPLRGSNLDEFGPRFPDLSRAYDRELIRVGRRAAGRAGHEGIYAGMAGPSFETPAEIRMLRKLGAGAVGMSTIPEVIAAVHAGLRTGAVSCLTNWAAGLSKKPLTHEEVIETTARTEQLLDRVVRAQLRHVLGA